MTTNASMVPVGVLLLIAWSVLLAGDLMRAKRSGALLSAGMTAVHAFLLGTAVPILWFFWTFRSFTP